MAANFPRLTAGVASLALAATLGAPSAARADSDTLRKLVLLGVAAAVVKSVIDNQQHSTPPAPVYSTTSYDRAEVNNIQFLLKNAGYYSGPIDGVWGPATRASALAWQRAYGFEADGTLEQAQIDVLNRTAFNRAPTASTSGGPISSAPLPPRTPAPYVATLSVASVRELQSNLQFLGYYDGTVDGVWGPRSQAALEQFRMETRARGTLTAAPGVADLASAALSAHDREAALAAELQNSLGTL